MALGFNHNQTSLRSVRWVRPAQQADEVVTSPAFGTLTLAVVLMVFMWFETTLSGSHLFSFFNTLGLRADAWSWTDAPSYSGLLTYAMLHADAKHFFWNVTLLVLVGSVIEWRVGWRAVAVLLIVGTTVSGLSHLLLFPAEARPLIGASGLVSTLFGAAIIIAGGIGIRIRIPRSSRWLNVNVNRLLLFWLVIQIVGLALVVGPMGKPLGVAYWVHLTGFGVGVAGGLVFKRMQLTGRETRVSTLLTAAGD